MFESLGYPRFSPEVKAVTSLRCSLSIPTPLSGDAATMRSSVVFALALLGLVALVAADVSVQGLRCCSLVCLLYMKRPLPPQWGLELLRRTQTHQMMITAVPP
jgi:hypothetical protein